MAILTEARFSEITQSFSEIGPIMVVGDLGIDKYTYGDVKKISPEAPVPVLEVSKEWLKLGLAANIGHNFKTLNIESTLFGVIGDDLNASVFENLLEDSDLNIWGLVRDPERPTIFKERVTTDTQQICRIDYENLKEISKQTQTHLKKKIDDFADKHNALILEDYAKGTLTQELLEVLIKEFKAAGKLVCIDPGRNTPPRYYTGANLLKPNLKEARIMVESLGYRETQLEKISEILVEELKLEKVVITLGSEGMALTDTLKGGKMKIIPTAATEVFDVSGAGDTAISLLTASLLAGATLEEAAWIGNCGSGVVVAKKGTATVDQNELHEFFVKLQQRI
jgi:rfaE bifunctional protein kinase chain/domain